LGYGLRVLAPATLRFTILLALASLGACAPQARRDSVGRYVRGKETIPLTTVVFSGNRYVAQADLGLGKPIPLMIHGNARMFLMLTHEIGEQLTGGPVPKVEDYGYSAKGKGLIRVPLLRLGTRRITDLRDVPVFDYVPNGASPVQGMVGVPFLTSQRAAIDFSRDVLILGVGASRAPNKGLERLGYLPVPMSTDANGRVIIQAFFPALGRSLPITPSTVSSALTLHRPPFAGRLPMTRDTTESDQSPSGTRPALYSSDRVAFEIAGVRLASFEDFAEYANVPESMLGSLGLLGYDWMKEHEAIIDYGNHFLYFQP
jgi:hypothetical protein